MQLPGAEERGERWTRTANKDPERCCEIGPVPRLPSRWAYSFDGCRLGVIAAAAAAVAVAVAEVRQGTVGSLEVAGRGSIAELGLLAARVMELRLSSEGWRRKLMGGGMELVVGPLEDVASQDSGFEQNLGKKCSSYPAGTRSRERLATREARRYPG